MLRLVQFRGAISYHKNASFNAISRRLLRANFGSIREGSAFPSPSFKPTMRFKPEKESSSFTPHFFLTLRENKGYDSLDFNEFLNTYLVVIRDLKEVKNPEITTAFVNWLISNDISPLTSKQVTQIVNLLNEQSLFESALRFCEKVLEVNPKIFNLANLALIPKMIKELPKTEEQVVLGRNLNLKIYQQFVHPQTSEVRSKSINIKLSFQTPVLMEQMMNFLQDYSITDPNFVEKEIEYLFGEFRRLGRLLPPLVYQSFLKLLSKLGNEDLFLKFHQQFSSVLRKVTLEKDESQLINYDYRLNVYSRKHLRALATLPASLSNDLVFEQCWIRCHGQRKNPSPSPSQRSKQAQQADPLSSINILPTYEKILQKSIDFVQSKKLVHFITEDERERMKGKRIAYQAYFNNMHRTQAVAAAAEGSNTEDNKQQQQEEPEQLLEQQLPEQQQQQKQTEKRKKDNIPLEKVKLTTYREQLLTPLEQLYVYELSNAYLTQLMETALYEKQWDILVEIIFDYLRFAYSNSEGDFRHVQLLNVYNSRTKFYVIEKLKDYYLPKNYDLAVLGFLFSLPQHPQFQDHLKQLLAEAEQTAAAAKQVATELSKEDKQTRNHKRDLFYSYMSKLRSVQNLIGFHFPVILDNVDQVYLLEKHLLSIPHSSSSSLYQKKKKVPPTVAAATNVDNEVNSTSASAPASSSSSSSSSSYSQLLETTTHSNSLPSSSSSSSSSTSTSPYSSSFSSSSEEKYEDVQQSLFSLLVKTGLATTKTTSMKYYLRYHSLYALTRNQFDFVFHYMTTSPYIFQRNKAFPKDVSLLNEIIKDMSYSLLVKAITPYYPEALTPHGTTEKLNMLMSLFERTKGVSHLLTKETRFYQLSCLLITLYKCNRVPDLRYYLKTAGQEFTDFFAQKPASSESSEKLERKSAFVLTEHNKEELEKVLDEQLNQNLLHSSSSSLLDEKSEKDDVEKDKEEGEEEEDSKEKYGSRKAGPKIMFVRLLVEGKFTASNEAFFLKTLSAQGWTIDELEVKKLKRSFHYFDGRAPDDDQTNQALNKHKEDNNS
jgi:hypothetical protein